MAELPLSADAEALLLPANPAVLGTVRPDGTPHTAAVWFDWVGERVLLNMDRNRRRLDFLRQNPAASITVLDGDNWLRQVTLTGTVSLHDDEDLADVDRLTRRYLSTDYPIRDRARVTGWLEPSGWYFWDASGRGKDPLALTPKRR